MSKKVSFAGAYGISSQGDDAALIVMVKGLRRRLADFDVKVITRHAGEDPYAKYGLCSIQNFDYENKSESIGKWFRGFNYDDDRSHLNRVQEEIASSDLLVLGAGNFLIDVTIDLFKGPIPYFVILTLMAKMVETPVMWYGISVGPFTTSYGRNLTRLAASLADVITVRDHQSSIELRQIGYNGPIMQLPDPVLGLYSSSSKNLNVIKHKKDGPIIAVSVRDMPSGSIFKTEQYVKSMSVICDNMVSRYNSTLLFIPQCTYSHGDYNENDQNIARSIVDSMRNNSNVIFIDEDLTVEECLGLYAQAELSLCTRLHANVYSAIQGVPSIAINYNPKVASFMNWLGCDDWTVHMSEFSPQKVIDEVEKAWAKRSSLSRSILARVAEGRAEVEQYADIACELITRRNA